MRNLHRVVFGDREESFIGDDDAVRAWRDRSADGSASDDGELIYLNVHRALAGDRLTETDNEERAARDGGSQAGHCHGDFARLGNVHGVRSAEVAGSRLNRSGERIRLVVGRIDDSATGEGEDGECEYDPEPTIHNSPFLITPSTGRAFKYATGRGRDARHGDDIRTLAITKHLRVSDLGVKTPVSIRRMLASGSH